MGSRPKTSVLTIVLCLSFACEGFAPDSSGAQEMARLYGQEKALRAVLEQRLADAQDRIERLERGNRLLYQKLDNCLQDDYAQARDAREDAERSCAGKLDDLNAEWRNYYENCEAVKIAVEHGW